MNLLRNDACMAIEEKANSQVNPKTAVSSEMGIENGMELIMDENKKTSEWEIGEIGQFKRQKGDGGGFIAVD